METNNKLETIQSNDKKDEFKFYLRIFLIDYENVKRAGLDGIEQCDEFDKVIILYSEVHNTLTFDIHSQLNGTVATIEYECVKVGRKDSLDHQLSSYLGFLVSRNPLTEFYIVSADLGFNFICDFWSQKNYKIGQVLNLKMDKTIKNKTITKNIKIPTEKQPIKPTQEKQNTKAIQPIVTITVEEVATALNEHSQYAQQITDIINQTNNRMEIFQKTDKLVSNSKIISTINNSIKPLVSHLPGNKEQEPKNNKSTNKVSPTQIANVLTDYPNFVKPIINIINSTDNRMGIYRKIDKLVSDPSQIGKINQLIKPLIKDFPGTSNG